MAATAPKILIRDMDHRNKLSSSDSDQQIHELNELKVHEENMT